MPTTARKIPIEGNPKNDGSTAASGAANVNADIKIEKITISGNDGATAVGSGKKIEVGLNIPAKPTLPTGAANDNVEGKNINKPAETTNQSAPTSDQPATGQPGQTPQEQPQPEQPNANPPATTETPPPTSGPEQGATTPEQQTQGQPTSEQTKPTLPTGAANDNVEGKNINKPAETTNQSAPTSDQSATEQPGQTPQEQTQPEQPKANPPATTETPSPTTKPKQGAPTPEQGTQPSTTLDQPPKPDKSPAKQSPSEQAVPPNDTTPPKVSKEELGNTGPHPTADKTPNTIAPEDQPKAATNLNAKGLGGAIVAGAAKKLESGVQSLKDSPKKIKDQIANRFSNDTIRKIRLIKDRRKLQSDLSKLENKVNDVKSSLAMLLLQFWLPTIYNMIMGFSVGLSKKLSNASESAQEKIFNTALTTLKTVKAMLETAKTTTSLSMATLNTGKLIYAGFGLLIIPGILLLCISPFIILILWIKNFLIIKDALTAAVDKIEKKVNEIIKDLEETFESIRKRVQIRKKIVVINRLLAATKDDRKEHYNQPKPPEPEPEPNNSQQTT